MRTLLLLLAIASAPLHSAPPSPLPPLFQKYWQYRMTDSPEFASLLGYPGQNRRWTDRSPAAYDRRKKAIDEFTKSLRAVSRGSLTDADRISYDVLAWLLDDARESLKWREELLPMSQMFGVTTEVTMTLSAMPHEKLRDYDDILARLEALPTLFKQVEVQLREGAKLGATYPEVAMNKLTPQIQALIDTPPEKNALLENFYAFPSTFSEQEIARLRNRAVAVFQSKVRPGLESLLKTFKNDYLPLCRKAVGWNKMPRGSDWYAFKVKQGTTTNLTPAEIHEIGKKEVARLRAAMETVKTKAGFSGTLEQFNEMLRTEDRFFHTSAEDLLRGYRDIAKRIDPQLPRLFGKLPRTPYGVQAIPDFAAPAQATGYYQHGSMEAGRGGIFFANTYNLKSRPKWEMEALTVHEAVPGHHLQIALAQELEGVPEFRKNESFNAFSEGWGVYSEGLGTALGLYQDPYSEYGRLAFEMWRSIRLVVDTGLHSMDWTRDQAIEYFLANVAKPRHDVEAEVDRYLVMPGQALGYKIGQLKIWELRKQAELSLGPKFSLRAFHDAVLENGGLPLDVLENRMKVWLSNQGKYTARR